MGKKVQVIIKIRLYNLQLHFTHLSNTDLAEIGVWAEIKRRLVLFVLDVEVSAVGGEE